MSSFDDLRVLLNAERNYRAESTELKDRNSRDESSETVVSLRDKIWRLERLIEQNKESYKSHLNSIKKPTNKLLINNSTQTEDKQDVNSLINRRENTTTINSPINKKNTQNSITPEICKELLSRQKTKHFNLFLKWFKYCKIYKIKKHILAIKKTLNTMQNFKLDGIFKNDDYFRNKITNYISNKSNLKIEKLEKSIREISNDFEDYKGTIRVYVRVRGGIQENLSISDLSSNTISIVNNQYGQTKKYKFNKVFGPSPNNDFIGVEIKHLLYNFLYDSVNICIFAYGQTGSGKTYTMQGPDDGKIVGLYWQAGDFLLENAKKNCILELNVVEIYNEDIYDLCNGHTKLSCPKLHLAKTLFHPNSQTVSPLKFIKFKNHQDFSKILQSALNQRRISKTDMNLHSSRSHLICTIRRDYKHCAHLIDLAGSERLSKSHSDGSTQKEAIFINKSLSALSDVISASLLKQHNSRSNHIIPYRNSLLTSCLEDSLSPSEQSNKTLVIIHVNPSEDFISETTNTLNFASKIGNVKVVCNGT